MNDNMSFSYSNTSGAFFVMIDVTSQCNYRCLHCYNNSGEMKEGELTDKELLTLASEIVKMKPIAACLCGGEPLLRNNIVEVLSILKTEISAVNMVTNGYFLTRKKAEELKSAGIDMLQISLDGINAIEHDTFRGFVGAFDKAIKAIEICKEIGIDVSVSCVPNKLNHKSIGTLLDMMYKLKVKSVRFMPLIPMGRATKSDTLLLSADEYVYLQYSLMVDKNTKFCNSGMEIEWGDPLDHYYRLPNNEKYGYKTPAFEIKSNGDVTFSSYLPIVVGNVKEMSLKEIWDTGYNEVWYNPKIKKFVDTIENIYDISRIGEEVGGRYFIKL